MFLPFFSFSLANAALRRTGTESAKHPASASFRLPFPALRSERTRLGNAESTKTVGIEHVEDVACTAACTSVTKYDAESTSDSPTEDDFTAALQMIMNLPLTDSEKADAVRRLLAAKQGRS